MTLKMENINKLKVIAGHIGELKKLIQKFDEQPGQIHQIDFDLALGKVRRIYENLLQLDVMSQVAETNTSKVSSQEIFKDEAVKLISETDPEPISVPVEEKMNIQLPEQTEKEISPSLFDLFPAKPTQVKGKPKKSVVEKMAEEKPVEIVADNNRQEKDPQP